MNAAPATRRAGQAIVEYLVVVAVLLTALLAVVPSNLPICRDTDTFTCLRNVLFDQHDHFAYSIALRDLPDLPRAPGQLAPILGQIAQQAPGASGATAEIGGALQDLPTWLEWDCEHTPDWSNGSEPICRLGPP